jgi:hypothetical protein
MHHLRNRKVHSSVQKRRKLTLTNEPLGDQESFALVVSNLVRDEVERGLANIQ